MDIKHQAFTFDDVSLVPQFADSEREDINIRSSLFDFNMSVPIISSPMDTISGVKMLKAMRKYGAVGIHHRYCDLQFLEGALQHGGIAVSPSKGLAFVEHFITSYGSPSLFCLDVAHGHTKRNLDFAYELVKMASFNVISGNIVTPQAAEAYLKVGVQALRVGIGAGCLASGTRILMANGKYKNIEEIISGDVVLNGDGIPVKVKRLMYSGRRLVSEVKTNSFYKNLLATEDHKFLGYDFSSYSKNTISSRGYKRLAQYGTEKWMEIKDVHYKSNILLFPRFPHFSLSKTFSIDIKRRVGGSGKYGYIYKPEFVLCPSYNLGYIFGTFLGDGHSHVSTNNIGNGISKSGTLHWYFNSKEVEIVNKLREYIYMIVGKYPKVKENKSVLFVTLYHKPLADFMREKFYSKTSSKVFPAELLVDDVEYLRGLYDGLIDSDGSIDKDGRIEFTNTSEDLIELLCVLELKLHNSIPLMAEKTKSSGNLTNCNVDNLKSSYYLRPLMRKFYRQLGDRVFIKHMSVNPLDVETDVWDIEIDDDSHSFIANNCVVHNSACTTRVVTGVGVPQLTAIQNIWDAVGHDAIIISDGGHRTTSDIIKSLAFGADFVILGGMLAGTDEAEGGTHFRGMASAGALSERKKEYFVEGISKEVQPKGSVIKVLENIKQAIETSCYYLGARNLKELKDVDYVYVTHNGYVEGLPR